MTTTPANPSASKKYKRAIISVLESASSGVDIDRLWYRISRIIDSEIAEDVKQSNEATQKIVETEFARTREEVKLLAKTYEDATRTLGLINDELKKELVRKTNALIEIVRNKEVHKKFCESKDFPALMLWLVGVAYDALKPIESPPKKVIDSDPKI